MAKTPAKQRIRYVDDPRQMRAAKSGVRQEIMDTVLSSGACSVADLAAELGRPADGLYYHVRALLKAGLLEEAGQRQGQRGLETVYRTPGKAERMQLKYRPDDPKNVAAITDIVGNLLRVTERDFRDAFRPDIAVVSGKYRNLWAARNKGWLSKTELAEANELISRLISLLNQPRSEERDRLYVLTTVIAPVEARAPRRRNEK